MPSGLQRKASRRSSSSSYTQSDAPLSASTRYRSVLPDASGSTVAYALPSFIHARSTRSLAKSGELQMAWTVSGSGGEGAGTLCAASDPAKTKTQTSLETMMATGGVQGVPNLAPDGHLATTP